MIGACANWLPAYATRATSSLVLDHCKAVVNTATPKRNEQTSNTGDLPARAAPEIRSDVV
ncbi:hypothetical protein GCM10023317_50620 [Actinopolymorpha pittospori]